jgi:hypothetical protein
MPARVKERACHRRMMPDVFHMVIFETLTHPKQRLWKNEPTFQNAFAGEALFRVLSVIFLGYESLKSASPGNAFSKNDSTFQNQIEFSRP